MEIEYATKVVPMDENFQAEIKKIDAEGWQLPPGIKPVVIYQVCRQKGMQPQASADMLPSHKVVIDESQVMILRNGVLIPN